MAAVADYHSLEEATNSYHQIRILVYLKWRL